MLFVGGPRLLVDGRSARSGPARDDAGAEVHAYHRGSYELRLSKAADQLTDETGRHWQVE